jgi:hypothetical protein
MQKVHFLSRAAHRHHENHSREGAAVASIIKEPA